MSLSDEIENCKCPRGEECPVEVLDIVDVKEFIKDEKDLDENFFLKIMGRFNAGVPQSLVNTLCKEDFDKWINEKRKLAGPKLI